MAKEEYDLPVYFRNKVAFSFGTLQRSAEEIDIRARIQNDGNDKIYFERINFDNGPLPFNSIVFLPPAECVPLSIGETAMHRFKSRTEVVPSESDVTVFARVVLEDGGRRYVPLCLMENTDRNWLTFVYELDEDAEDTTQLVDGLLVATNMECISYMLMRHRDETEAWIVVPEEEECLYYGNSVLDTINSKPALTACKAILQMDTDDPELQTHKPSLSHLKQYAEAATCKTLFEVREANVSDDRGDRQIEHLIERIKGFLEPQIDINDFNDLKELFMDSYKHTKFIFSDKIPLEECIVPVVRKCVENIVFDPENLYYDLLSVLVRDCDVAYRLMFDMGFGKVLLGKLLDTRSSRWSEREVMLDLLIEIVSHGKCMRNFLRGDISGKGETMCDMLLLGAAGLQRFSLDNMKQRLEAIGKRVELFLVLSRVEQMYQNIQSKLNVDNETQYGHLETLMHSVNEAIDMVKVHHVGRVDQSVLSDIHEVRQYTVSYIMETRLPAVVTGLMGALLSYLENFPVAPLHIGVMLERPLWLVAQYINLIDFGDCLLSIAGVCNFVDGMGVNNVLRSVNSADSHVAYCRSQCERMAVHTFLLKMSSALFGKNSCPQIVSAMYHICTEYSCGYAVMATLLAEQSVIQALLQIVNAGIEKLKSSGLATHSPQENLELWQLLNLLCETIVKDDSGRLVYVVGKRLVAPMEAFLECFVPKGAMLMNLDLQPIYDLHQILMQLYSSSALTRASKGGRLFESVDLYLSDLLDDAGIILHPDTLKQSYSKALHMNHMSLVVDKMPNSVFLMDPTLSKTMPRSMLTDQFGTVYNRSSEAVELGGVHWSPNDNYSVRVSELGVVEDKANHYRTCQLYVAPPERLPEYVHFGIRLLRYASTMHQYVSVYSELLQHRENMKTLLRLWVHVVASISPDLDTVLNVEMGAFKSFVGYEWFFASSDAIPLVTNLAQIVYAALHHMSCDSYCHEETDEQRPVVSAPLRFINDDILTVVVLSASSVMVTRRWLFDGHLGSASRECLIWLSKLISYWYRRFQKSQGYLMNKLMGWYTSIPCMADGAALLIVSCGPVINPNCAVDISIGSDDDKALASDRRCARVAFEGQCFNIALSRKETSIGDVPNAAFWGLIRRIESLKVPIFADFMCAVSSRCYSTNPCTVVLASEIAHLLIVNNVPIMTLLTAVSDRCLEECIKGGTDSTRSGNISGKAYRLLTFVSLMAKAIVYNEKVDPSVLVNVNYWILSVFNQYTKNCKAISEGCCQALFQGYVHIFICHNKLWENHHSDVTRHPEFNNYMKLINGAIFWICQTLNGCKAKDTEPSTGEGLSRNSNKMKAVEYDDGKMEHTLCLSWETILAGFVALKYAFEMPFTALNILYTVLSGPMELIVKIINKQIDSEIIKVTPSAALWLHGIVRQLCDALLQHNLEDMASGTITSDAPLQLLILQLLHDVCASIHQTGPSQDVFICALVYGTTHAAEGDILANENKSDVSAGHTQQAEDIYSDIVGVSKSRTQRKSNASVALKSGIVGSSIFQGITDALEAFRDTVAAGLVNDGLKQVDRVALSAQVANVLLLLNAFDTLSRSIAKDAAERTPPKSLPGYIFLKAPSFSRLFRHATGDELLMNGLNPSSTRSILARVVRMTRCEDWSANTCLVSQTVPSPLADDETRELTWISRCFMYNGSRESVQMWKTVRFLATAKLVFADELMQYAPIKTKRTDRPLPNEGTRYIRSVSTRAPSKHVDAYESEKAGAAVEEEDCTFSQANIEKAVAQLNGVITSQTWLDFDNDLVTNGLNLRSVLVNPGILKDYSARATFLNALSRHVLIKELLISVGVDVR
ncbi:hypothetical protein BaOVIS_005580 [Babesia ovis]|uniref:Uncharacterized protein n=1 Tax=Babesia ovis TaxID=5869 RepID=A0A9W5TCH9_BABOV|nr:hypothetical protein BaOVIS_005580 [Babesia ovis]